MRYELHAFNTDSRYDDTRYREYTTSKKRADMFERIPKIQFTDSGHGIVFNIRECKPREPKKKIIRTLGAHVSGAIARMERGECLQCPNKDERIKGLRGENSALRETVRTAREPYKNALQMIDDDLTQRLKSADGDSHEQSVIECIQGRFGEITKMLDKVLAEKQQ